VKALLMAALVVIGLFVAGSLVVWAVKAFIGVLFYVLIGALIVGGVVFIAGMGAQVGRRREPAPAALSPASSAAAGRAGTRRRFE
jgi:hypothetical protein